MGGTGVVDRFLDIFSRYIDSGFGLLSGEVAFIATTLIVLPPAPNFMPPTVFDVFLPLMILVFPEIEP